VCFCFLYNKFDSSFVFALVFCGFVVFFFFSMADIIFPDGRSLKKCFKGEQSILQIKWFYTEE